jgi:signal transduction histidine kinase/ligand-binding sensor domain-containing protein/DNA-binding response OmpR family regulator
MNVPFFYPKVLLLILAFLTFDLHSIQSQNILYPYKIKYITIDEGLSHTDAVDIVQDKKGFIWIGTNFGLNRFDGYTIRKFYNNNEPLKNAFKNRILCMYPDLGGDVWISSEDGLQRFDVAKEHFVDYHQNGKPLKVINRIYKPSGRLIYCLSGNKLSCYEIENNSLNEISLAVPPGLTFTDLTSNDDGNALLTSNNGLWELSLNGKFQRIKITGLNLVQLNHVSISASNEILLTNRNQLYLIRKNYFDNGYTSINTFKSPYKRDLLKVIKDQKNNYWLNDTRFLYRLDDKLKLLQTINYKGPQEQLNFTSLNTIMIDRSQCLWVATNGGGINYFDLNVKAFYSLQQNPGDPNSLSGRIVRPIFVEGDSLWVGTTNGLNLYNLKTKKVTYYNTYNSNVRLKSDGIESLVVDNKQNLWIANSNGIAILDASRKKILHPPGHETFPQNFVETLAKDCFGNIWFGRHTDKLGVIWKDDHNLYHVKYHGDGFSIFADSKKPELFVSTVHGLQRLIVDRFGSIISRKDYMATEKPNSLSSNYPFPVVKQDDSTIWVGTIGGGLNKLTLKNDGQYNVKRFGNHYGIFNDVESIQIDEAGRIWMGGNGLECFDPRTLQVVHYDKNDGLQGNSFKVGSSYKGPDGRLYFGGVNGLNFFYPDEIKPGKIIAHPTVTDILIGNHHPLISNSNLSQNVIQTSVPYADKLKLKYLQNNFVIFFSSMLFANPFKCHYRYMLSGFDNGWRYTDGKYPSAAYSNLNYRKYKFTVEATNDDGKWSPYRATMEITIEPPWWKSSVAEFFYGLIFLSALSGIYIYQGRLYKLRRDVDARKINEIKREEMHRQREELHQQQLLFFTNISHEFRTPLTLIIGPMENLIHLNKNIHLDSSYQLILRNTKRLMNLITELMNFKKIADGVIKLQVRQLNIYQFCFSLIKDFENIAISKNITLKLKNNTGKVSTDLIGYFDIQILEKILFNLLNNSFKYTEIKGDITLELFFGIEEFKPLYDNEFKLLSEDFRAEKYIYFRIADTGVGITSDSISHIFNRYYRVNSHHLGSGVGLALVKSLTQLHKGDIYVYSERQAGTEIIIGIPWGKQNYGQDELALGNIDNSFHLEPIDKSLVVPSHWVDDADNSYLNKVDKAILIVEDNTELRLFLRQVFEKHYRIYEAEDGDNGLTIATEKIPDVIISDVMMPKMSGIEFCKAIKEKFETRHIPFIILSAKDSLETKLNGLDSGADFYFSKPLSIDLLLLTVQNVLEQHKNLKERFLSDYLSNATMLVKSDNDKDFFTKLNDIINSNIAKENLDVDFICNNLFMSRTKLYQKIKSITGQSVGEFIRTIRLKKSVEIMTHENVSMNEVARRTGMQSGSNFSRVFKKEFGKSPLQFVQSLKK